MGLVLRAVRHLDTSCFDREPRALATGLSPRVLSMGGVAEVPAVSLAGWRFGTQRPRFFSVDYRPTEAHSRDLRTGHLRFLSGDHSTPITLRCHFHTEQSGYSTFRVFSFRLRPFIGLHYVTSLEIHRIFLVVVFPLGNFRSSVIRPKNSEVGYLRSR